MKIEVIELAPCKKQLRIEVDAAAVDSKFDSVTSEYCRQAKLDGFRKGKAPRERVLQQFAGQIAGDVKRELVSEAYRRGIAEHKLSPVISPEIEELGGGAAGVLHRGQLFGFLATIETEPDFALPEYKGIPAKREKAALGDAVVENAITALRDQRAQYQTAAREVRDGDYVVIHYTGTCEGQPITAIAPTARGLTEQKNYWLHVHADAAHDHFIPGFTSQLVGAKAGDKRTVKVDFPADFVVALLGGRSGVYEVDVAEVKEKSMPALDDAFAKSWGAASLDKLREGVRTDLENDRRTKAESDTRAQVVETLLDRVKCELPQSVLINERRNVIYNIILNNQRRGVSKEEIEKNKEQIHATANMAAQDRVKADFVMRRIAEKEQIGVTEDELAEHVVVLAKQANQEPKKYYQELQKRNGLGDVHKELLHAKVVDFLVQHAAIEEVNPQPAPATEPAAEPAAEPAPAPAAEHVHGPDCDHSHG